MDGDIKDILIEFDPNGSLATTHKSQGSDMGLFGGFLGWEAYDERLPLSEKYFAEAGIQAHANSTRPRDHGVWMPLLHMYPDADIPVIEISLPTKMNAEEIYKIGQALSPLREQQILLIGSGSITHNLAELSWHTNAQVPTWASTFRNTVVNRLQHQNFDAVLDWPSLPFIERNHPTLEHFAPLFFAMGTGHRFNIVHSSFSMGSLGMDIYRFD
jgi:4,5-DOPA dioxygenase extradiol